MLKTIGTILLGLGLGTALFFSCGKASDDQKDSPAAGDKEDVEIRLSFEAYTQTDVDVFRVYAGKSKEDLEIASDFDPGTAGFDFATPEITLESAGNDVLTGLLGSQACFQLRAVRGSAESDASNLVCTEL